MKRRVVAVPAPDTAPQTWDQEVPALVDFQILQSFLMAHIVVPSEVAMSMKSLAMVSHWL